jgi:hypothetical protein
MSERIFSDIDEANRIASLMKKLSGQNMTVVPYGWGWIVKPSFAPQSIVNVTEALLRQLGK